MEHIKVSREVDGLVVSRVNLYILDNDDEKHDNRPFALLENLRTTKGYENQGYATEVVQQAVEIARSNNCYKIFLATSSTKPNVAHLYKKLGFDPDYKATWHMAL